MAERSPVIFGVVIGMAGVLTDYLAFVFLPSIPISLVIAATVILWSISLYLVITTRTQTDKPPQYYITTPQVPPPAWHLRLKWWLLNKLFRGPIVDWKEGRVLPHGEPSDEKRVRLLRKFDDGYMTTSFKQRLREPSA